MDMRCLLKSIDQLELHAKYQEQLYYASFRDTCNEMASNLSIKCKQQACKGCIIIYQPFVPLYEYFHISYRKRRSYPCRNKLYDTEISCDMEISCNMGISLNNKFC